MDNREVCLENVYLGTIIETDKKKGKEKNVVFFEKTDFKLGLHDKKSYIQYRDLGTGIYYYVSDRGRTLIADRNFNEFKLNVRFDIKNLRPVKEILQKGANLKIDQKSSRSYETAVLFCKTFQKYVNLLEKETNTIEVEESILSGCYDLLTNIYSHMYLEIEEKELTDFEKYLTALSDQKMLKQKPKLKVIKNNKTK